MALQNLISYVAVVLGLCAFLPQTFKTLRTKQTKDISLGMYLIFWAGVILWLVYGFLLKNPPIIVVNAVVFVCASIILFFKLKYDQN